MARIADRDIAEIRDRIRIDEVVGDYVQLRRAGADSLKGLCPFHDEKTPSFHVRPNHGHFHCFGCGEGGDVYAFIQKIEHVSFVEAVELLADRVGYTITYTGAPSRVQRDRGSRSRLLAANAAADGRGYTAQRVTAERAAGLAAMLGDEARADRAVPAMTRWLEQIGMRLTLSDLGAEGRDLAALVAATSMQRLESGYHRPMGEDDVRAIYEAALGV